MREVINEIHGLIEGLCGQKLMPGDWAPTPKRELGDLAIPCFKLAKGLGKAPPQVAADLAPRLSEIVAKNNASTLIDRVVQAGPYLNIFVRSQRLAEKQLHVLAQNPKRFGSSGIGQGKCVFIDLSSPNIAKEIALHHLRSTAIGNALANIAEFQGYRVVRINYLGDWGTAHGKNILALKKFGSEHDLRQKGVAYMLELYIRFNQEAKTNTSLNEEAKAAFALLEQGDPESRRVWTLFRDISIEEFKKTYARLGIRFDYFDGESLYEKDLDRKIQKITDKVGTKVSDGALICELPGHNVPVLLKKDDGASLYITRDLCAIEDRAKRFNFDLGWYVVAVQQKLHFKQLFDLVALMKEPYAGRAEHICFGMLSFGSKTMKSREGNVIFLNDVLDEAKSRALEIIRTKNPELSNADDVAEMIGTGAVLFFDLSQNRNHDIKFEWERALAFDGDTAPFVQYTHARCTSLLKKGRAHLQTLNADSNAPQSVASLYDESSVRELIRDWAHFTLHAERALAERDPSQIAISVLNISKSMNRLYHSIRFLDEKSPARLQSLLNLTEGTKKILAHGLGLLGIRAPEEM